MTDAARELVPLVWTSLVRALLVGVTVAGVLSAQRNYALGVMLVFAGLVGMSFTIAIDARRAWAMWRRRRMS